MAVDLGELCYRLKVQVGADLQGDLLWQKAEVIVAACKDTLDPLQHISSKYALNIILGVKVIS